MPEITEQEYQEFIALSNDLVEYLDQLSTHTNRFNIVLAKLGKFTEKVTFYPPAVEEEYKNILEQLGETMVLIGEDFTAIGLNGKANAQKLIEIGRK